MPVRRRKPAPAAHGALAAGDVARFLGLVPGGPLSATEALGDERLAQALATAHASIEQCVNQRLPAVLNHDLRQAVLFTTVRVLYTGNLDQVLPAVAIPATARYHLMRAGMPPLDQ